MYVARLVPDCAFVQPSVVTRQKSSNAISDPMAPVNVGAPVDAFVSTAALSLP